MGDLFFVINQSRVDMGPGKDWVRLITSQVDFRLFRRNGQQSEVVGPRAAGLCGALQDSRFGRPFW